MAEIDKAFEHDPTRDVGRLQALKTADLGVVGPRLRASEVTGSFGRW